MCPEADCEGDCRRETQCCCCEVPIGADWANHQWQKCCYIVPLIEVRRARSHNELYTNTAQLGVDKMCKTLLRRQNPKLLGATAEIKFAHTLSNQPEWEAF